MKIQVTYYAKWQIKDATWYKWTTCKKLINCRNGKEIMKTMKGSQAGYYINREFVKLSNLRSIIELIPANDCPF